MKENISRVFVPAILALFFVPVLMSVLVCGPARAESLLPAISSGSAGLRYFELQKDMTSNDIPVLKIQRELLGEVPLRNVPPSSRRPYGAGGNETAGEGDFREGSSSPF